MFGFFRRQVLLPPSSPSWTSFRGREGEEGCFVVVLFRYEANSFWYAALLSLSLSFSFPETRDGLHGTRKRV